MDTKSMDVKAQSPPDLQGLLPVPSQGPRPGTVPNPAETVLHALTCGKV